MASLCALSLTQIWRIISRRRLRLLSEFAHKRMHGLNLDQTRRKAFRTHSCQKRVISNFLTSIGVPRVYLQNLWTVRTEGELLELLPEDCRLILPNLILEGLYPPSIDDLVREPLRIEPRKPGGSISLGVG